jgi:ligand-binding sensor domain-containing protein
MIRNAVIMLACGAALCGAQVVDSSVYGDNSIEWQTFVTDGPVTAFTVKGGTLWYATTGGAGTITMATNKKTVHQQFGDVPATGVTTMATDSSGGVWIGSTQGVAYAKSGGSFTTFTAESGLSDNAVNCIYPSGDGSVWVGTENGVSVYKNGSWSVYRESDGLAGNSVRAITRGKNRSVWLATNKGISHHANGGWTTHDMNSGLSWNDAKALGWDPRKEELWAAVGEKDVNQYDGKEWKVFMGIEQGITSIMVDTQSRVWFGAETGLFKYNGFEWVYDQAKLPFAAAYIGEMYRDGQGDLWYGLDTGVLHMSNPYPF